MKHRKKHRVKTRPPQTTAKAKKARFSWRSVTIPVVGLVVLAVTFNLIARKTKDRLQVKSDATKVSSVSPGPPEVVRTNEAELDDIDRATELANRGTALLAQGKIEEAVATYKEAARLSPEDEDM